MSQLKCVFELQHDDDELYESSSYYPSRKRSLLNENQSFQDHQSKKQRNTSASKYSTIS